MYALRGIEMQGMNLGTASTMLDGAIDTFTHTSNHVDEYTHFEYFQEESIAG